MAWIKLQEDGVTYQYCKWEPNDSTGWEKVSDDDARIVGMLTPTESYADKRKKSMADGGYGTFEEQLEMINEEGLDAWRAHCQSVKDNNPKP